MLPPELIEMIHAYLIPKEDYDTLINFRKVFKLRARPLVKKEPKQFWNIDYVNRHKRVYAVLQICRCRQYLVDFCICRWCGMGVHAHCNLGETDYE